VDTTYEDLLQKKLALLKFEFERIAAIDCNVRALHEGMLPMLTSLENKCCGDPKIHEWFWYFSPENPCNIFEKYPTLVQYFADLAFVLRRSSIQEINEDLAFLSKCSPR